MSLEYTVVSNAMLISSDEDVDYGEKDEQDDEGDEEDDGHDEQHPGCAIPMKPILLIQY